MKTPFVIADVGSNHRNRIELALQHIEHAHECHADAVKFQLFTHQGLYGVEGKMDYELPKEWIQPLANRALELGIEFMCSAFSPEEIAVIDPWVARHKIASSEALDPTMWEAVMKTNKPVIISTGGLNHEEVAQIAERFHGKDLTLFECVANYPASITDYNLFAMNQWQLWRHCKVGVSDHTNAPEVLGPAAVGFGAKVFEVHFDCLGATSTATPDSPVSIGPQGLIDYVNAIRLAFGAIGDGRKCTRNQHQSLLRYRRRPIATKELKEGDTLKFGENFGLYRSLVDDTHGAPAQFYKSLDEKKLKVALKPGQSIFFTDVEG